MSYSMTLAIHLPLFPSLSSYTRISLTAAFGTYATTLECKTYILKNLRALTKAYACFSIILYFSSESLNVLLKNEIGCSKLLEFFCNNTVAIVSSDANEKIAKSFVYQEPSTMGLLLIIYLWFQMLV